MQYDGYMLLVTAAAAAVEAAVAEEDEEEEVVVVVVVDARQWPSKEKRSVRKPSTDFWTRSGKGSVTLTASTAAPLLL